jgi:outer membrane porin, OprD family
MTTVVQRLLTILLAVTSACLMLLPGAPGEAQQTQSSAPTQAAQTENTFIRAPDSVENPTRDHLLDLAFPELSKKKAELPAFFRDTDLNLHFRSFYLNRQRADDTFNEAWALGGWLDYKSGYLLDTFQIGARYYTSLPAYAPDDRPGSQLLTPGQDAIGTFGEAWAAFRYKEYARLQGGRMQVDEGYVNPQDNRMVPNTFEALTLSGKLDWFRYDVGYLWNIKPRDSNDFISMSRQAGVPGDGDGMILSAFAFTPIKDLVLYAANYFAVNTYNTVFTKAEYTYQLTKDLTLQFGLQFTDQRNVGDARVGDFNTWNVGAGARMLYKGLRVGAATHFTGDEANIRQDYGSWPGYLSLQVTDFDRAREKAFGIGLKYDFEGTLLPFQIPGFSIIMLYGQGNDRINPTTGGSLPTTREGNLDIVYNVPAVKGLSLRFRNAYVGDGGPVVQKDFRIIVNYELDLL